MASIRWLLGEVTLRSDYDASTRTPHLQPRVQGEDRPRSAGRDDLASRGLSPAPDQSDVVRPLEEYPVGAVAGGVPGRGAAIGGRGPCRRVGAVGRPTGVGVGRAKKSLDA